jgi:ubiquinone/menaquinone biosynthesis C-methylase UbiE
MNNIQSFSQRSDLYAQHRPQYPRELFAWIASLAESHERAWDCATGNGQAAEVCAEFFQEVQATDISAQQIEHAIQHPRVKYSVTPAEKTPFEDNSFDAVIVAQAVHWFDLNAFYGEVKRVLKPGGLFVVAGYAYLEITPEIDQTMKTVLLEAIDPFWAAGNRMLMTGYQRLEFPFERVSPEKDLAIEVDWNLDQCIEYLRTWSAVKRYEAEHKIDPALKFKKEIAALWGDPAQSRRVTMPLFLLAGRSNPQRGNHVS